jgi:hypothetical protein
MMMPPCGTRQDWSDWNGVEIGTRILHFLNCKMDHTFGYMSPSLSSNTLSALFGKSRPSDSINIQATSKPIRIRDRNEENETYTSQAFTRTSPEETSEVSFEASMQAAYTIVNEDMSEFFNYSETPISLDAYIKRLIKYTKIAISQVNLAVALVYIHRLEAKGACEMNKHSIFR